MNVTLKACVAGLKVSSGLPKSTYKKLVILENVVFNAIETGDSTPGIGNLYSLKANTKTLIVNLMFYVYVMSEHIYCIKVDSFGLE